MPTKKKTVKKVASTKTSPKKDIFAGTGVFGWLIIGLAMGGLIVLLRYLMVTLVMPANIYVIEPALIIPGMAK
ncbi:MAG: hypothetical protein WCL07_01445 [bacterium]